MLGIHFQSTLFNKGSLFHCCVWQNSLLLHFYVFLSFCLSSCCPCLVLHEFWDNILRSSGLAGKHITYWTISLYPEPFLSPQKHFSINNRKQNERTKISCKYLYIYNSFYLWLEIRTGTLFIVCFHDSQIVTLFHQLIKFATT